MTTDELIRRAAQESGLYIYEMKQALDALTDAIVEAVAEGEEVKVHGFGVFRARDCAARFGFNPKKREAIQIPACARPVFKPKKRFIDAVKNMDFDG